MYPRQTMRSALEPAGENTKLRNELVIGSYQAHEPFNPSVFTGKDANSYRVRARSRFCFFRGNPGRAADAED